jgi:hypothetical protein
MWSACSRDGGRLGTESSVPVFSRIVAGFDDAA